ncbi:hypothetical protein BBO99_00003182 [Phytophthora kernoviae]|uniref:Uncharacterized protein n=2 Tax=Phytophthora kernoviae TaxID=325452 RepID=A0A421EVM7_9STRA|nr:hypothetical protein G195_002595 [Phytophthora kernoviae 00238/432]KAG2532373.1 hypothetical protein JM16_000328 [Phytophthora kernoviae]KAG2533509.1 hypothetical protein JM18_000244 [Phytophthora kernoviae]RLN05706.1 hypothetical protein BBI17_003269 [Phytophthora kernoviae]RLN82085.1 hypothetical protein BBO99_00003182 [Phytophthora kernoviae]
MRQQQHAQIQILRDSVPVVDLDKEPRTSRSWAWVCAALVSRDKGECAVQLVESVFVDKQQIWSWYCTDNGVVRRKPRSKLLPEQVHRAFLRFAAETPAVDTTQPVAVCWFEKNDTPGSVPFLTAQELWDFLHSLGSSSTCSAAVSTFVRPRGELDPVCYANLEHEFTLQKTGRAQGKPFWLALGGQRIASKDVKLNASVNELVQRFVGFVEKNKKCRVTRAEKQLVDLFIRRYQSGEDGDYLAEAYYGDGEPLGVTFPGYYYRDAQVCANCYEFYMLVEKVRMKALEQISRNGGRGAQKTSPNHRNSNKQDTKGDGAQRRRMQQFSMAERREEEEDDGGDNNEEEPRNLDSLQHVWECVWAQTASVAAAITKKDAAELYSFVNPHPAVAMVLGALGALLLGSNGGDWGEVKRVISQDKLVSRLNRVDLDALSERAVLQAAAHTRNPLFTPEHIAPISTCAARFCDWVRTVLQAYAWKQRLQMEDVETRHLPVSFFCKFLFSEAYLRKVDMNLALSIYTAVTNAITLDGRIRLCRGALRHMDLGSQLAEIDVPIVLVQSVENALVAPTNVDPFLQGRANILHQILWNKNKILNKARRNIEKHQCQNLTRR